MTENGERDDSTAGRQAPNRQPDERAEKEAVRKGGRKRRLLDEHPVYRNLAAVTALAGAVAGIVVAVVQLRPADGKPKPVRQNVEYVLDGSAGMNDVFDGHTKLDSAVAAIRDRARTLRKANLALRRFGGECDENSELLVDLGTGKDEEIGKRLADQAPRGEANLARAVVEASTDFSDLERFPDSVEKDIVVVTGRGDTCEEDPAGLIRSLLPPGIHVSLQFVGLRIPEANREKLRQIAAVFEDGKVRFVDTEEELQNALAGLAVHPVLASTKKLSATLEAVSGHLNDMLQALRDGRFGDAVSSLKAAGRRFGGTDQSFRDLSDVAERSAACRKLYQLARTGREAQRHLLRLASQLIVLRKKAESGAAQSVEAYNEALAKWNEQVGIYNAAVARMNELVSRGSCS